MFAKRLPRGRQKAEIRVAAEVRLAAKALAVAVLRSTPKGPAQDVWIKNLATEILAGFPAIDLEPIRPTEGN